MAAPSRILFLPGALGDTAFWRPVADRLAHPAEKIHVGWPGFGNMPPDTSIRTLDDLAARLVQKIDRPTALVAQSMGGIIAIRAALERLEWVTHLVLAATSGGMDMNRLGAQDWRPAFQQANPGLPDWFINDTSDLTPHLRKLTMPVLLLWGDADPISPVAAGNHLAAMLPNAALHIIQGADHDVVNTHPAAIAPLIDRHLRLQ